MLVSYQQLTKLVCTNFFNNVKSASRYIRYIVDINSKPANNPTGKTQSLSLLPANGINNACCEEKSYDDGFDKISYHLN